MNAFYRYQGLEARYFDDLDELSDFEDVDFFQWLLQANPGTTLDVGCGTGRVLQPLADLGHDVVGLDASEEMLEICRRNMAAVGHRPELIQADMRSFQLGRQFANILIPGFSIQLLASLSEWRACLDSCYRHLKPNGQLLLSLYYPLEMLESGRESSSPAERTSASLESGDRLVALQGWTIDKKEKRLLLRNIYRLEDPHGRVRLEEDKTMEMRWFDLPEVIDLLLEIGFKDAAAYGDFLLDQEAEGSEAVCIAVWR